MKYKQSTPKTKKESKSIKMATDLFPEGANSLYDRFVQGCENVGIKQTWRQWKKFNREEGSAYKSL